MSEHEQSRPESALEVSVDTEASIDDIMTEVGEEQDERRGLERMPYDRLVGLKLVSAAGVADEPQVLQGVDISPSGMSVVSRKVITPGAVGVLQLVRANGRVALLGARATSCSYGGEMRHRVGLEFTSLPNGVRPSDFLDDQQKIVLFDPLLEQNIRKAG